VAAVVAAVALIRKMTKNRVFQSMQVAAAVVVVQEQIMAVEVEEVPLTTYKSQVRNRYRETPALPGHLLVAEQVAALGFLALHEQQVVVVLVEVGEPQEPQEPQLVGLLPGGVINRAVAVAALAPILLETHL
jgi:Asp-tRNA(Asn)/Glu-tRNA(Gln) amidotransferase C subunit